MLGAVLQALVEPARQLGVPSLPQRILDVVVPDRVGGRRAWARNGHAAIEVRGVNQPGSAEYVELVEAALEGQRGVEWARVNCALGRVVVGVGDDSPPLAELVAIVDSVEDRASANPLPANGPADGPLDRAPVGRALVALAADGAGVALAGISRALALTPLPVELASLVTAVDTAPRLRGVVEGVLGRPTADTTIAVANAAAQGLAQGIVGLGLDAAYRVMALAEARANSTAWRAHQAAYLATPGSAASEPVVVERPAALPPGPIERWADGAGVVGLTAFAVGVPLTGSPRRAIDLALSALPKSARLGREGFATQFGRVVARRGGLVLDRGRSTAWTGSALSCSTRTCSSPGSTSSAASRRCPARPPRR